MVKCNLDVVMVKHKLFDSEALLHTLRTVVVAVMVKHNLDSAQVHMY